MLFGENSEFLGFGRRCDDPVLEEELAKLRFRPGIDNGVGRGTSGLCGECSLGIAGLSTDVGVGSAPGTSDLVDELVSGRFWLWGKAVFLSAVERVSEAERAQSGRAARVDQ